MEQLFRDRKDTHKHKHTLTFFIFIFFVGVLIFIIYTTFNDTPFSSPITGKVIKTSESSGPKDSLVQITARLDPPQNLNLKTQSEKISLKTKSPATFYLGKQKFELKPRSSIIIDNFEGELSINIKNISKLDGKTTKVYIDGIPITPSKKEIILSEQDFDYSFLKISNLQTSLEYNTSGDVNLQNNKVRIKLNNEKLILTTFKGSFELTKNQLRLEGLIPESNVKDFLNFESVEEVEEN